MIALVFLWLLVLWMICGCDQLFGLPEITASDGAVDTASDAPPECPLGYDTMLASSVSSRYRVGSTTTSWDAAAVDCANDGIGSHLIVIDADVERREIAATTTFSLWIGLSDRISEGTFIWVTPQGLPVPVSGSPWGAAQPDDQLNSQDCVRIQGSTGDATYFDDSECSSSYRFACECDGVADDPSRY